jgi:hypothetical protein|tara:strand:+ start:955 stop:1419 length:465 start_codon:yes stop_codon:yes gene_type:complete
MIDAIQKREEQEERRHEQGRRLPLYAPPPPEMPEEEEEEEPPRGSTIIDYRLAKEARTVRATKRKLHQIIREEKAKILKEITPGDAGIAAAGGGTPADQGFAAAEYTTTREDVAADDFLELLEAGWRRARGWGLSAQELGNITEKFITDKGYKG